VARKPEVSGSAGALVMMNSRPIIDGMLADAWNHTVVPVKRVQNDANALAVSLKALHGGQWCVQFDPLAGFVLIAQNR
jgi:hypothetical protein